ncbi:unnamed protein product [marine sediment metagenome]|uniref:Uncharacterized protein n=1 Tax=marine sediment metagenome TaxID=412755 RepID=X1AGV6_9ZZZZ
MDSEDRFDWWILFLFGSFMVFCWTLTGLFTFQTVMLNIAFKYLKIKNIRY